MDIALWSVQVLLAVIFVVAGIVKATRPRSELLERLPYVEDFSHSTIRAIGVAELFGAAGLILPEVTGIAPMLTPLAASGLAIIMLLAIPVHARRGETSGAVVAGLLLAGTIFVAWGRFGL